MPACHPCPIRGLVEAGAEMEPASAWVPDEDAPSQLCVPTHMGHTVMQQMTPEHRGLTFKVSETFAILQFLGIRSPVTAQPGASLTGYSQGAIQGYELI